MKIAIDGVRLSRKPSGVTFIVVSIIKQLAIENPDWEIYVLLRDNVHPLLEELFVEKNIKLYIAQLFMFNGKSLVWSLTKLNRVVNKINPDYFIAPNTLLYPFFLNRRIKKVIFIHDLVFKTWPNTMSLLNKIQINILFKYSIKSADLLWCNSNYTKNELFNYYSREIVAKRIFIGSGLNVDFNEAVNRYYLKAKIKIGCPVKPYIVFVGTFEPRKNILFLLQIFKHLSYKYDLLLIGGKGWGNAEEEIVNILSHNEYPKNSVQLLTDIKTDDLVSLYFNADFYLTTSFNEGLGLPLLEAMACGCPVIAAHNSAMVEVVDGAGITVEGWETNDWLKAISLLESNRQHYVNLGYERIKRYNWGNVIKSLVKLLHQI